MSHSRNPKQTFPSQGFPKLRLSSAVHTESSLITDGRPAWRRLSLQRNNTPQEDGDLIKHIFTVSSEHCWNKNRHFLSNRIQTSDRVSGTLVNGTKTDTDTESRTDDALQDWRASSRTALSFFTVSRHLSCTHTNEHARTLAAFNVGVGGVP